MDNEEIRLRVSRYLKQQIEAEQGGRRNQLQIGSSFRNIFSAELDDLPGWQKTDFELRILGVLHEFIRNGWLHPGNALVGNNQMYPWITITDVGRNIFLNEGWAPLDQDGYVGHVRTKVPGISSVTLQYLGEAVAAYHRRHLLSATLTLGVASENEVLDLIDAYLNWLDDSRREKLEARISKRTISKKFEEFKKSLTQNLSNIPDEISQEWETYLDGVFQFIRLNRNDAGHPTGKSFEARTVFANLQAFCDYAIFIDKMKTFFNS